MLKQITIKNIPGISVGKIIKKSDIVNYHTFNQIHRCAQRKAQTIIRDAESVAEEVYNHAWTEGYIAGVTIALQDLAKFIHDSESQKNRLITSALETVTLKLKEFFDHEETVCQLLGILVDRLSEDLHDPARVVVTVPEKIHPHSYKLKDIFKKAGFAADFKRTSRSTISVEYGKEIWTYEVSQVVDRLALAAVKKALLSHKLQAQCELSSHNALKSIRDTLSNYLDNAV